MTGKRAALKNGVVFTAYSSGESIVDDNGPPVYESPVDGTAQIADKKVIFLRDIAQVV